MSEWRQVSLADLSESVQYGITASAIPETTAGPRLLRITDIVPPRIDWSAVPPCDIPCDSVERFALRHGDIVVARTGATVGYAKYIVQPPPKAVFASYLVRFRIGDEVDAAYVGHVVQSAAYKAFVLANAGGAAQPNANARTLGAFTVPLPNLNTQRRVAAVLSAFDKLIAINERRIALLEDLARSLYREWFVHFRFPGHEEVEFVNSELGEIPEGWEVRASGAVLSSLGGGTPSKKRADYWNGGLISWLTPSDLTRSRNRYVADSKTQITTLGLKESGARMFPAGSVLMTSRATLGVLAITTRESTCNQGFIVIPPVDDVPSEFIYEWLANHETQLAAIATGATFKEITKAAFKRFPFLLPTRRVLAIFAEAVGPVGEQISSYEQQNRTLATTRDLLLPRLVTGRLDISDVDLGDLLPTDAA